MNDKEFLNKIRELPCIACGFCKSEAHHIKTRGSGGKDDWFNVIPLCSNCHTMSSYSWHNSKEKFFKKFPHVLDHLIKLGWQKIGHKLLHEGIK